MKKELKNRHFRWQGCIFLIGVILLIGGIFAVGIADGYVESLGTIKYGECIELVQTCGNCSYVNISSIQYPNKSIEHIDKAMTQIGTTYNYSFCNTEYLGQYIINTEGDGISSPYDFEVTPTGFAISSGQSLSSLGLIISILIIATLFMFTGYKFSESDRTFAYGLFFMAVSFLLVVYSLHLGYIMTRDILYPLSGENTQFSIYNGVMWGLIAMAFLFMTFLTFKVLKELKVRKSMIKYGEGYNPDTKQYG
jgi:hypothetical protein